MRLLHTSDWHIGMLCRNGMTYVKDQEFFINRICEIAVSEGVEAILIAGDVFDKSIASKEALQLYDRAITHICADLGISVYIIAGNHDGADRLASLGRLLEKSGLYIVGALQAEPVVINHGNTDIYMLPWITTDKVKNIYSEQADDINSLEDAYRVVLDDYHSQLNKNHRNILLSHAFIVNAETSVSDRAAEVGRATMVSADVFDGFDYVALGHIHRPQQIRDNIRYSGTPMIYSFGKEEKQEKSVTILDTDTMEQIIVPLDQYMKRTTLRGTFDELLKADYPLEVVDGYVRLEVTDKYIGFDSIALLREKYRNLLEIESRSYEGSDSVITMTMDELKMAETDPGVIFGRYCEDIVGEAPNEHMKELFMTALKSYEQEVSES